MTIKYSTIIPCYNRSAFIRRAIMSVAKQDCIDLNQVEIIVIDDGSTDGTASVVRGLDVSPCALVYVERPHCGQPGTVRNVGLGMAKGELIGYLDSDDYFLPHHLATVEVQFKKHPELMMVSTNWAMASFSVQNGEIATKLVPHSHAQWVVNTNCRVHRRSCLDQVARFNEKRWGEDQDFFNGIEAKFKTKKVPYVTTINGYIKNGNNLTYDFDAGIRGKFK